MSYNGWSNYETWNVALWIDNEQGSYSDTRQWAQEAFDNACGSVEDRKDEAKSVLAAQLKDWIEEMNPLAGNASMFSDLLSAALSEVDWYEIAEHYLSEVDTDIADEEEEEDETE